MYVRVIMNLWIKTKSKTTVHKNAEIGYRRLFNSYFLLCLSHSLEKGNIEFSRYFIRGRGTANGEQKQE